MSRRVVVVGGGHNGLVAANYLARAGHRVTVLEARSSFGGPVGSFEYIPGYRTSIANSPGSLEGVVIQELELERFGLRFHRPEVTLLHPMRDSLFVGWRDQERVAAQMNAFSPGEAARHRALIARLDALGEASGLSLWEQPMSIEEVLEGMDPAARAEFERTIVDGSLRELLDASLKSDEVKSIMMMVALNTQLISPDAPGSAMGLLMRPISRASTATDVLGNRDAPLRGSVGLAVGSMSAIIDALLRGAETLGVELRSSARVAEFELNADGELGAIVLESGERIEDVDTAVVTLEPSHLPGMLPSGALGDAARPEAPKGAAFKLALGLDGLPSVADAPEGISTEQLLEAQFRIAPDPAYITEAVESGIAGQPSAAPIMWGLIPTLTSPELAPEGRHLMSINVWHAPYELGADYWDRHGGDYVASCLAQLEPVFPGLTDRIVETRWLSPHDIEREFGLTGSNITHGDMTPDLMLNGRPGREFVETLQRIGIVLGGAGTWPGGYVTGAPGRRAAKTVQTMTRQTER